MLTTYNLFDKYRSISIERIINFLTRKCIEHRCAELQKIEFKLEDLSWNLYLDNDYFKMDLVFPITEEENHINTKVAKEACLEITKLVKVLKAHYTSHDYIDKENGSKVVKYHILLFSFETFCYNMYDFGKLFYDSLNVILCGYNEYHKLYNEIVSKLPNAPIGFRNFESNNANEESHPTNRHRIGFI